MHIASRHLYSGVASSGVKSGATADGLILADGSFRSKILAVLGDPENISILEIIRNEAKSALTISSETHIPTSSVYRKLVELKGLGLILMDRVEIRDGRRRSYYLTAFSEIRLDSTPDSLRLEIVPSAAAVNRRWLSLLWGSSRPSGT